MVASTIQKPWPWRKKSARDAGKRSGIPMDMRFGRTTETLGGTGDSPVSSGDSPDHSGRRVADQDGRVARTTHSGTGGSAPNTHRK